MGPRGEQARSGTLGRALLTAAALVLPCLGMAAPASASVHMGPDRIVVRGSNAQAAIQRAPFRLSILDRSGRPVLREVAGSGLPGPGGTGVDPEPGGVDTVPEVAHYAPLSFEVGGERSAQHPGGLWTGNMLVSGKAGAVQSATRVTSAAADGEGVRLTVATTDPTRSLTVRVLPERGNAIRVLASVSNPAGVSSISESFDAAPGEAFRGFGGRHNALDQRGTDFYNWVEEENFGAGPAQFVISPVPGSGRDRYLFPNGPHAAYYVQSLFISSRPYGFLLNETELSRWRMASDRPDAWQVNVGGATLDYTVAVGDAPAAIRTLTAINGRHRLPESWTMGPAVKRNVRQGNSDPRRQQELIARDLKNIDRHGVKLEGYSYESWDTLDTGFVRRTNQALRRRGIRPIGYVRAYVNDEGNFDPPGTFNDAVSNGYVTKTPGGAPYLGVAVGPAAVLDFTNPATVRWWERRKIRKMLDLGFEGFMQDFGEQVTDDMRFHNGETGRTMHNRYPIVFHRTTREIVERYQREHPGRGKIFMYTRSGYSGRPGAAAFEEANFPGDETTDWQRSTGIASLATDMLNRAVGGAYGFTTDIGGYIDSYVDNLDKELFIRWSEWAALSPFFRLHNSCCDLGTQMPWSFDGETLRRWKEMAALHVRARPLIRRLWAEAARTGMPITRPLWLQFPGDARAARQDQQWMLGPDVLVAPVVADGATSRSVYFPRGCWQHPGTGESFTGPASRRFRAPLGRLPYFFRCGVDPFAAAGRSRRLRIRLTVTPSRTVTGRRVPLRFRATTRVAGRRVAVPRALLTFRGRKVRMDLRGRATRRSRFRHRGRHRAKATKRGYLSGRTRVRVRRAARGGAPRFTG